MNGIHYSQSLPRFLSLALLLLLAYGASAQASAATFSQSSGTYSPTFASGTGVAANFGTGWDDDQFTYTLPFTFTYNGIAYTQATLSSNGFLVFGGTLSGNGVGTAFDDTGNGLYLGGTATNNGFAAFNMDLEEQTYATVTGNRTSGSPTITSVSSTTNLRVGLRLSGTGIPDGAIVTAISGSTVTMSANASATSSAAITPRSSIIVIVTGTAPNRTLIVQFTRARRYNYTTDDVSFQMRFSEGGGVASAQTISVVYGTCTTSAATGLFPQVGIRTTTSDFNSRTTTNNWSATTAATANTDRCTWTNTVAPASGRTFTWTPCVPPTAFSVTGGGAICPGATAAIGLANSQSGVTYQLVRNPFTNVGSPVSGTGSAIAFAPQSTAGSYSVVATLTSTGCVATMTGSASVSGDATVPTISGCPGNQTLNVAASTCAQNYPIPAPTTLADNCSGTLTWNAAFSGNANGLPTNLTGQTSGSASASLSFSKGSTTVTLSATDASSNVSTANCSFTVTVVDNEPPTITCATGVTVNNTPGLCTGTTTLTAPTVSDNCPLTSPENGLSFDGVNDGVSTAANSAYDFADGTVELWVKPTLINGGANTLVANRNGSSTRYSYHMSGSVLKLWNGSNVAQWNTSFTANQWYHIAFVESGSATTAYVNGTSLGSFNYTSSAAAGLPLNMGTNGVAGEYFPGTLDEVRIWNVARTQAQIQANMNSEISPQTGLVAYYKFNQGTAGGTNTGITTATATVGANATLSNFALTGTSSNWVAGQITSAASNAPATYAKGSKTVTWTVADVSGNTSTCAQTVTVLDNEKPTTSGCPTNKSFFTVSNACNQTYSIPQPTIADNCTGPNTWQASFSGNANGNANSLSGLASGAASGNVTFNKGLTAITLASTDASGNVSTANCSFTVLVTDNVPPVTPNLLQINAICTSTPPAPTTTDNCAGTVTGTTTTTFPITALGTTTITWTFADGDGNSTTAQQNVVLICDQDNDGYNGLVDCNDLDPNVHPNAPEDCNLFGVAGTDDDCDGAIDEDLTAPTIQCPENQTVAAGSACTNTIGAWNLISKSDICSASVSENQSPAASTVLSGHNASQTVVLTANDAAGNTTTCSFTVTLKDITAPTITCPANQNVEANGSCGGQVGTRVSVSKSDNCPADLTESQSPAASTSLSGHNDFKTVILTANDGHGQSATCSFTVTLKDVTPPSITCPPNQTVSSNATCGGTVGTRVSLSKSDNCPTLLSESQSPAASTVLSGHNDFKTVVLTANDGNGNSTTCSFTVTLKDVTPPTALCKAVTLPLNSSGAASLTTAQINNGSADNCTAAGGLALAVLPNSFSCANVGTLTSNLTVTDAVGNTASCSATITILDVLNYSGEVRKNANDGLAGDKLGSSLAISDNFGLVGAPEDKIGVNLKQGSATIFNGNSVWSQAAQLVASDGAAADYFGFGLGLEGGTAVVGAYAANIGTANDQGAAYVFTQSGAAWPFSQKLLASDGIAYDYFGNSVSVSNAGLRAIIGAYRAKIGANASQGAAYIFEKSGTTFAQTKKLAQPATDAAVSQFFGSSVALAGDLALAGATGNASNRGAAYLFKKDMGGANNWGQAKKLTPSDGASGDIFGTSAAQSASYALVGAPGKTSYMGAAYVFGKDIGGADNWGQAKKLVASDGAANDRFGQSVALQGNYAYVGALQNLGKGAVYVFQKDAGGTNNWGQLGKYMASDGFANDQFGISVAVNSDGTKLGVGANLDDQPSKTDIGSVYFLNGAKCGAGKPEGEPLAAEDLTTFEKLSNLEVMAFPNPFSGELTVEILTKSSAKLTVTDAAGRIVSEVNLPGGGVKFELATEAWPAGLYFVQVSSAAGVRVLPVAKI